MGFPGRPSNTVHLVPTAIMKTVSDSLHPQELYYSKL